MSTSQKIAFSGARRASLLLIVLLTGVFLVAACQGPAAAPTATAILTETPTLEPTTTLETTPTLEPTATPTVEPTATPIPTATATPEAPQGGEIVDGFRVYEATSGKTTVHVLIQADYVKPEGEGYKPYYDTLSSVEGVQGLADGVQAIREMAEADGYWRGGEGETDVTIRLVEDVVIDQTGKFGSLYSRGGNVLAVYEKKENDGTQLTGELDLDKDVEGAEQMGSGLSLTEIIYPRGSNGNITSLIDLDSPIDDGKGEVYKAAFVELNDTLTNSE